MRGIPRGLLMRVSPECYPCFFRQANIALDAAGADEALKLEVLSLLPEVLMGIDNSRSPSHASSPLHHRIQQALGRDPFERVKTEYNTIALGMLDSLRETVRKSGEPLMTAARLAIAGNIIDFGIYDAVDLQGTVRRALDEPLGIDQYARFEAALRGASRVLYLVDNTGEVVFDMLLVEQIKALGLSVTAAVKSGPILNDSTLRDAREVGLTALCEVVETGSSDVGTVLDRCTEDFIERFTAPGTVIVSKGQGNFETLLERDEDIHFLLQAKCDVVARMLGLAKGAMVLAANPRRG